MFFIIIFGSFDIFTHIRWCFEHALEKSSVTPYQWIQLTIIQCYIYVRPDQWRWSWKKDAFYQQLQRVLDKAGKKGHSRIKLNEREWWEICWPVLFNQFAIGGSILPHKRIHKATWRSPDHVTENQIAHICINKTFGRTLKYVRAMRGADTPSTDDRS